MSRIIRGNQLDPKLVKEHAFTEGRHLGFEEGKAAAHEAVEQARASLEAQKKQQASLATEIAIVLASQLVGELAQKPEIASILLEKALRASGGDPATIFVHPKQKEEMAARFGGAYQIVTDSSLAPGDCIIETSWGRLDARISTQLEKYAEALREIVSVRGA